VCANRVSVVDGPVWSSAGITAGIDLALHCIGDVCGDAVAAAVAEVGASGPEPLLATGALEPEPAAVFEPDDPPHAASSSTSDPSPVAAAHPLLRIRVSNFARMARSPGTRSGLPGASRVLSAPGRHAARPGGSWNLRRDAQPVTMLLSDSLITCHMPPTPLPVVVSAFAPLYVYSGMPL